MIPAGYMAKRVEMRPAWLDAPGVVDVYSLSNCVSPDFADYIPLWKHNGWWLFDSPGVIEALATAQSIPLSGTRMFYYEVHGEEYDQESNVWRSVRPEPSFPTRVIVPAERRLEGFDVVTFSAGTSPECSPLSCNSLASSIPANRHCLARRYGIGNPTPRNRRLQERGARSASDIRRLRAVRVLTPRRGRTMIV